MRLKDLKETMLLPDREILINRMVNLNGTDVLLISITSEQQTHRLWTLSKLPESYFEKKPQYESEESYSNRERVEVTRIFNDQEDSIFKMIIQDQLMTFNGGESRYCMEQNHETYMKLQHFIERGLELGSFAEVELKYLFLTFYEQDPSEPFPHLDLDKELDITLRFRSTFVKAPTHAGPILLELGDSQKSIKYSFYDSVHDKNRFFYIHALKRYDIQEEIQKALEKPTPQGVTEEEWQHYKDHYIKADEEICSKEEDLAFVEYEAEDNIRLNFYAKSYLDAKPRPLSGNFAMSMSLRTDRRGPNGLWIQKDVVDWIDKTFNGDLIVELLSYYVELPEKSIKL
ncbi:hypothetical protein [Saccharibacillus kuerlensis]|uniref:Uncharacterized protein n=1 Tax=Saccharibacillus kuerlensis TaxID=459527 RepID=A0ABQ2L6P1_9BACL|nr:hypothetical protein [Saccharibacillus kuerlensis]GGO02002.1 hypothetical protein GCM10010969_24850 [Saccharibacillus kuerlensis]